MKPQFNSNKIGSGELRTPVIFYEYAPDDSPFPTESELKPVYSCFGEPYNASMKDLEILNGTGAKKSVTINIRDTFGEYYPSTENYAEVQDYRYGKLVDDVMVYDRFNVIDVRPNLTNNDFITVLLAVVDK